MERFLGTGFFVNDAGDFLTASHLFNNLDPKTSSCSPHIYLPVGGWTSNKPGKDLTVRWHPLDGCQLSTKYDVAFCTPKQNPFKQEDIRHQIRSLPLSGSEGREDGTPVAFTGFPLRLLRPVTAKGSIASYNHEERLIIVVQSAWPGASGSPLYLEDGSVTGMMIKAGVDYGAGLSYALPSEAIIEFLLEHKIRFQQEEKK
jgi:hypothetical protein